MDISSALGICLHFILFKVFGLSQEMDLPLIQILLLVLWLLPRPSASYGLSAGFPPTHHCFFLSKFSSISAWMTLSHKFLLACYFSPGSFYGRRGFTSFINLTKFLFYLLFYFWTSTMSHLCIYIHFLSSSIQPNGSPIHPLFLNLFWSSQVPLPPGLKPCAFTFSQFKGEYWLVTHSFHPCSGFSNLPFLV